MIQSNKPMPEKGSLEATDPFSKAPPGYALTVDNGNLPFGSPPETVDPEEVLETAIKFMENPRNNDQVKKLLIAGVSIETLVEGFIINGFQEGKFSLDAGLLVKAPLALYMADMAEEEMLPYKLFENDDALDKGGMDDEDFLKLMKVNNPAMFSQLQEVINQELRKGGSNTSQEKEQAIELQGFLGQEGDQI